QVDLHYLSEVISEGADPNATDRYGQTVLHEVSRAWSVCVMRFFLDRGSDLNRPDDFGVTALHVAAALDYQDMVQLLKVEERLNINNARTHLDLQTPLHFAAKSGAVGSLRLLLQAGAQSCCRDYKHRTPLQLAANLDRSEAARVLLELGAEAGVKDSDGQLCITALIGRMSSVAHLALGQFHVADTHTRQQFFYLNRLEPEAEAPPLQGNAASLEVIVQQGKFDLIMHPVVLKLIQVKWELYGAWLLLILNFLFIVAWTTVAISVSVRRDASHRYLFPQDWWRVLVVVLALLLTMEEVLRELQDISASKRKLRLWQSWATKRIDDDLKRCHPMWPEEKLFLQEQRKQIHKLRGSYRQDLWNIFDWLVYVLLAAAFGVHVADAVLLSDALHAASLRLFSLTIIFLWLRLMKHVRAFRPMGPFIVMLGKIVGDVMRFLFLYAEIFIPYACAFWIIFGGVFPSMQSVPGLLYSLYRITLVDEYEFDAMAAQDALMAPLLCGSFLAASSILCFNLLIALLTDTFQRVYGNAQANAVMQQASVILQVEESMPRLRCFCDEQHIFRHCAPLADAYDHDITMSPGYHDDMRTITVQIKVSLLSASRGRCSPPPGQQEAEEQPEDQTDQNRIDQNQIDQNQIDQNQIDQDLQSIRMELQQLRSLVQQLILSTHTHTHTHSMNTHTHTA
uniref:Si:ch73-193i2.2 n=1 Tax=Myripristis murdjan TaxID=586833 RepID=A0A667XAH7_9TELE